MYSTDNENWSEYTGSIDVEGATKILVKMQTVDDNLKEADEVFTLNARLTTGQSDTGSVTLINDDTNSAPDAVDDTLGTYSIEGEHDVSVSINIRSTNEESTETTTTLNGAFALAESREGLDDIEEVSDDSILYYGDFNQSVTLDGEDDNVHIKDNMNQNIDLGDGDNYLEVDNNSAQIIAGSGSDTINIDGNQNQTIDIGSGDNRLDIDGNSAAIYMGDGNDSIRVGGNANVGLDLNGGDNTLDISGDSNNIFADGGENTILVGGNANGVIDLGTEADLVRIDGNANQNIALEDGDDLLIVDGTTNQNVYAANGNDGVIIGGNVNNYISGGDGEDSIILNGYTANTWDSVSSKVIEFENIKLGDGTIVKGSADAFETTTVTTLYTTIIDLNASEDGAIANLTIPDGVVVKDANGNILEVIDSQVSIPVGVEMSEIELVSTAQLSGTELTSIADSIITTTVDQTPADAIRIDASDILANDSDIDGDTLNIIDVSVGDDAHGTVSLDANGNVIFTPDADYVGEASFEYTIDDGNGATDSATVSFNIESANNAPDAVNDAGEELTILLGTKEDAGSIADWGTANDDGSISIDVDGVTGTITATTRDGSEGTLNFDADSREAYGLVVTDGPTIETDLGESISMSFDETLLNATIGIDSLYHRYDSTREDASVEWTAYKDGQEVASGNVVRDLNDTDGDGSEVTNIINVNTAFNSIEFASEAESGQNANFDIRYLEADVVVGISTDEDTAMTIDATDILSNDSDPDGDAITLVNVEADENTHGTVGLDANGNVIFTPDADYNGEASFTYTINDGNGGTDTATVSFNVDALNDAPDAVDDIVVTTEVEIPAQTETVMLGSKDGAGSIADWGDLQSGSVSVEIGGVTGTISGTNAQGNSANVTYDNGNNDYGLGVQGSTYNEIDLGESLNITFDGVINGATIGLDSLYYRYDEHKGEDASVEWTAYKDGVEVASGNTVSDIDNSDGDSNTVTNTISVDTEFDSISFASEAESGRNANFTVSYLETETEVAPATTGLAIAATDILANDSDIDGDTLSITSVNASDDTHGTVSLDADGNVIFIAEDGFSGDATFTYTVSDSNGGSDSAIVAINVPDTNENPNAVDDILNSSREGEVLVSENFENGAEGWSNNQTTNTNGNASNFLGRFGGSGGEEAVSKVFDLGAEHAGESVNIKFDMYEIDSWDDEQFKVFTNGEEVASDTLSHFGRTWSHIATDEEDGGEAIDNIGSSGKYWLDHDEVHSYEVEATVDSNGEVKLGFGSTLNQSLGDESYGIDNLLITAGENWSGGVTATENMPLTIDATDILANDSDGDGDTITLIGVESSDNTHGTVTIDDDGNIIFTPDIDYNGEASFTYSISDGNGGSDSATVTFDIAVPETTPIGEVVILEESFENLQASNGWHVEHGDSGNVTGDHGVVWDTGVSGVEVQRGIVATSSDGTTHAELDAHGSTSNVTMSTTVALTASTDYTMSFDVQARDGGARTDHKDTSDMRITFAGEELTIDSDEDGNLTIQGNDNISFETQSIDNGWTRVIANYNNVVNDTAPLVIEGTGAEDTIGMLLDNIRIVAPETQEALVGDEQTSNLSEEGLDHGLVDSVGVDDTTDSILNRGRFELSDAVLGVSLEIPTDTLTSGGEGIVWNLSDDGQNLVGSTSKGEVVRVAIDDNGNYTTELVGAIDHSDTTVEDQLALAINVNVADEQGEIETTQLNLVIEDDAPVVFDGNNELALHVEPVTTNLSFVVDISSSMSDSNLDLSKAAIESIVDSYESIGDVNVNIVQFYSNDTIESGWTDADGAKDISLDTTKHGTDIEQGLNSLVNNTYDGSEPVADQDIVYFFGDGNTYGAYQTDFDEFTGAIRDDDGNIVDVDSDNTWSNFITSGTVDKLLTYSVNTNQVLSDIEHLADNGENVVSAEPVTISDISQLEEITQDSISLSQDGDLMTDIDGDKTVSFGADGGHIASIEIAGQVVTYDPDNPIQIIDGINGSFSINFEDGTYTYSTTTGDYEDYTEDIKITVVDGDGDGSEEIDLSVDITYDESLKSSSNDAQDDSDDDTQDNTEDDSSDDAQDDSDDDAQDDSDDDTEDDSSDDAQDDSDDDAQDDSDDDAQDDSDDDAEDDSSDDAQDDSDDDAQDDSNDDSDDDGIDMSALEDLDGTPSIDDNGSSSSSNALTLEDVFEDTDSSSSDSDDILPQSSSSSDESSNSSDSSTSDSSSSTSSSDDSSSSSSYAGDSSSDSSSTYSAPDPTVTVAPAEDAPVVA